VALALAPGMPIPPFLPQTLTATISDNTVAMFVAKYTTGPLKLYAGYEYFRFTAPSDPQTGFSDIAGNFLWPGLPGDQQHEYQQYGLWRERRRQQGLTDHVDRREIRRYG
jgi:hypothetical protein